MSLDFTRLGDINKRDDTLKYLRWYIRHNKVEDDEHAEWMIFAAQIEAQFGNFKEYAKQKELWKEVL